MVGQVLAFQINLKLMIGTSWSAAPTTPFTNQWFAGAGPTSDFIGWGSNTGSNSYQWNGSAWSTGAEFRHTKTIR